MHGIWDSIRGMTLLLHIDDEIYRLNLENDAKRLRKQRSPSPVPSSASAMTRQEQMSRLLQEDSDERHLNSLKSTANNTPKAEKKIAKQVLKCCCLNGGFTWASIILFEQLILPILRALLGIFYGENSYELHMIWNWLQSILSILFGMMWVLPIFLLSKIVSSLWFADIANAAYRVRKGRPLMIANISKLIADFLLSLLVQILFLAQSMLINFLPFKYLGQLLCFLHLCLLYSLYCFEYKWFNMGWELNRRLTYIENNWPYFLGFGIPLTVLTNMTNSIIVSSCIFSIFFPLFILSGNEAKPLVGTTDTPLRLFLPVVCFSNLLFNRLVKEKKNVPLKISANNSTATKDVEQVLLLKRKEQERYLKQMFKDYQSKKKSVLKEQQEQEQHRYKQPPQLHLPRDSIDSAVGSRNVITARSRSSRHTGLRPLVPIPVPGAPKSVNGDQKP